MTKRHKMGCVTSTQGKHRFEEREQLLHKYDLRNSEKENDRPYIYYSPLFANSDFGRINRISKAIRSGKMGIYLLNNK